MDHPIARSTRSPMPPYDFAPGAASCVGTFIASSPARVSAGARRARDAAGRSPVARVDDRTRAASRIARGIVRRISRRRAKNMLERARLATAPRGARAEARRRVVVAAKSKSKANSSKSELALRDSASASYDPTRAIVRDDALREKRLAKIIAKAVTNAEYELALERLQNELVCLMDYAKLRGKKIIVIFEGRDAAGKGGCISRITEVLSPRVCRVCALSAPTEAEKSQWYFQRYARHLPSAGEIVLFDRSWYNRSGVERVMGFATSEEVERFEREVNVFERMLLDADYEIIKLWFDVSDAEQERRFRGRLENSEKRWKLSPMDLFARSKWYDYALARDLMFENTSEAVPWSIVPADDKRVARLNAIQHILAAIDYDEVAKEPLELPPRQERPKGYEEKDLTTWDPRRARVVPQVYTSEGLATREIDGKSWKELADAVAKSAKKKFAIEDGDGLNWPK